MSNDVLFAEKETLSNHKIGIITLNVAEKLNALTLSMIKSMHKKLQKWEKDQDIVAVLLDSSSNKAFCAGGDIRSLYYSVLEENSSQPKKFFDNEYRLLYLLHTYPKPLICWGHGIVMGGGLGLMSACDFRVVNDISTLAMPEVSIGFYPDVAGSHFLGRLPQRIGLFVALTGCRLNSADALYLGLANKFIENSAKEQCLNALQKVDWLKNSTPYETIFDILTKQSEVSEGWLPYSKVRQHRNNIIQMMNQPTLERLMQAFADIKTTDEWLLQAKESALLASPLSQAITYHYFNDSCYMSLKERLNLELKLSESTIWQGDFFEGVRALLIDKDNQPKWRYPNVSQVEINNIYQPIQKNY